MGINVYEQLRANIDLHAIPCHPSPEIIEIFKLIFTKEEATVALGLRFRTLTASDIAKNIGVEKYNVQNLLESIADKGMIFAKQTDNIWKYSLINRITIYENCGVRNQVYSFTDSVILR